MDGQIQGVENDYTNDDTVYEEEVSEGNGLIGKVFGTVLAGTAIGVGAFAVKNRDKIKDKFNEIKAKKQAKKVQKHLDALAKLGWDNQTESEDKEN